MKTIVGTTWAQEFSLYGAGPGSSPVILTASADFIKKMQKVLMSNKIQDLNSVCPLFKLEPITAEMDTLLEFQVYLSPSWQSLNSSCFGSKIKKNLSQKLGFGSLIKI